jgi:molybdenum cofactor cytidylyltransferase
LRIKLKGMTVPAIVLAAGASRRLGQPKQLVRVAGETLLAYTLRIAREATSEPILVVLGARQEEIAANVDLSHVNVATNPDWEQGIASSIRAGIRALMDLDPDASAVLFLVCDQPRLTADHLRSLIEAHEQAGEPAIVASHYAGATGIPAIFPAGQFANLLALKGDAGARYLLRNTGCAVVEVEFSGGEADIDTPSDLERIHDNRALKRDV